MTTAPSSYLEARRAPLAGFHRRIQAIGSFFVGPVTVLAYLAVGLSHPCWQAALLLLAAAAMNLAWLAGFSLTSRGRDELGSALVSLPGIGFCGFALLLRQNHGVAEALACLGLMAYASLFSRRVLLASAAASVAVLFPGILLPLTGLSAQMPIPPAEQTLFDLTYVVAMVPVTFFFLRASQFIGEDLFRQNEAARERQAAVLHKVQRIEPDLASAVSRIQETARSLTDRAREQSSASSEVQATSDRLRQMVAASTEAALETRSIAEKTRDDSVASIAKLARVEEEFRHAVGRIEAVRARVEELARRIEQTEALNETLGDIVENLKMLGLNASLEAARAGEKGEGFQVVARELRRMVSKSGQDLFDSRGLLAGVRQQAAEIARDTEASTSQLHASFDELRNTAQLVQGIAGSFAHTSEKVDSIARAASEQRAQIGDIAAAMHGFERATSQLGEATATLEGGVGMIAGAHQELQAILAQGGAPKA